MATASALVCMSNWHRRMIYHHCRPARRLPQGILGDYFAAQYPPEFAGRRAPSQAVTIAAGDGLSIAGDDGYGAVGARIYFKYMI